jgi:histidine triad (HIT) family protein
VSDCLFCRIVAGELPAAEVLSDDLTFAFRDINPVAPTHVLVIPKEHIADASDIDHDHGEVLTAMIGAAQQIAQAEGIADSGYRLVFNIGRDAGNTVPHLHLHVLGGRGMSWPPG